MIAEDRGPGSDDLAMQEGYSTAPEMAGAGFGAGMGLPNIKPYVNILNVHSKMVKGPCWKPFDISR